jgi:hypothetical protein
MVPGHDVMRALPQRACRLVELATRLDAKALLSDLLRMDAVMKGACANGRRVTILYVV